MPALCVAQSQSRPRRAGVRRQADRAGHVPPPSRRSGASGAHLAGSVRRGRVRVVLRLSARHAWGGMAHHLTRFLRESIHLEAPRSQQANSDFRRTPTDARTSHRPRRFYRTPSSSICAEPSASLSLARSSPPPRRSSTRSSPHRAVHHPLAPVPIRSQEPTSPPPSPLETRTTLCRPAASSNIMDSGIGITRAA